MSTEWMDFDDGGIVTDVGRLAHRRHVTTMVYEVTSQIAKESLTLLRLS